VAIDVEDYIARYKVLQSERKQTIDAKAKDVAEFLAPNRGRFQEDDRKPDRMHGKRGDLINDSSPGDALEVAANGMYSGLTPPSRPWHLTKFEDDGLNEWGPSKTFMDILARRRNAELRRSNFYSAMHNSYTESIAFGSTLVYMMEFPAGGFAFRTHTFGEYYWSRNERGEVDTVFRPEWWSARKLLAEFGEENLSRQVKEALKNNQPYTNFEILHVVEPRTDRDVTKKTSRNKPFASLWFELANEKKVLRESGLDDFCYAAGVWMLVGSDNYGSGNPGFKKLPDIKQLQDMEESCVMATHRELDPPLQAPVGHKGEPIRRNAGGTTFYDGQSDGFKRLYEFKFDIAAGEAKSEAIRQRIYKGFYNDLFLMITSSEASGQPVTATQIIEMQGEKMLQLGPFIERQEDELLDKAVIFVTTRMLARPWVYGLPMPPEEVQSRSYKVEYISLLAQAQRQIGVRAIDDSLNFGAMGMQADPSIMDNYNLDAMVRERADLVGLPAKCIRPEDEVAQIRANRQKQMAEAKQAEALMAATQGAANLGKIKTGEEDPNVLTDIVNGLAGGGEEAVQ
jgi:hypothetical protein